MLILERQLGQKIVIGHGIVVEVVALRGDKVRLGIVAPIETPVYREEVKRRIDAQDRARAESDEGEATP